MTKEIFSHDSGEYKFLDMLLKLTSGSRLSKSIINELHCGQLYAELLAHECIKEYDTSFAPTENFYLMLKEKKLGYFIEFEE